MGNRYYSEGNTVRVIRDRDDLYYRRQQALRRQANVPDRRPVQRRQTRSVTLPLTLIMIAGVIATVFICYNYLCLKNSVDNRMNNIKVLETKLESMKTENDAFEQSIDTSVDLNYVYNVAVNELGMVHASQGKIIEYSKNESEYVRQYDNIPSYR